FRQEGAPAGARNRRHHFGTGAQTSPARCSHPRSVIQGRSRTGVHERGAARLRAQVAAAALRGAADAHAHVSHRLLPHHDWTAQRRARGGAAVRRAPGARMGHGPSAPPSAPHSQPLAGEVAVMEGPRHPSDRWFGWGVLAAALVAVAVAWPFYAWIVRSFRFISL